MSEETIELRVTRFVGLGVHEDLYLTNYSQKPVTFELQIEIDGDFADQQEVNREREQQGHLTREVAQDRAMVIGSSSSTMWPRITTPIRAILAWPNIHRGLAYRVVKSPLEPEYKDGRVCLQVSLAPLERMACLR